MGWLETQGSSGVQGDADQRDQQWSPRHDSSCWHDRTGSCNRPKALLDEAHSDSITSADPIIFSSWKYRFPLALVGFGGDMSHNELITAFVVRWHPYVFSLEFPYQRRTIRSVLSTVRRR